MIRILALGFAALAFFLPGAAALVYAAAPNEELVAALMGKRAALAENRNVNLPELSRLIVNATTEANRQISQDDVKGGIRHLEQLEQYAPLAEFPSFRIQATLALAYERLSDTHRSMAHRSRADAMVDILMRRIGSGKSPDDPKRIVMNSEISDWRQLLRLTSVDVKSYPHAGKELYQVIGSGNPGTTAYFELHPRARTAMRESIRMFDPVPLARMSADHRAAVEEAREKRRRFMQDNTFPYDELVPTVERQLRAAIRLVSENKPAEAMEALKPIEKLRPIEEIPMTELLSMYSFLHGKLGNTDKQRELRRLIYGVNQAIAHSGDALSPETAVEVIAIREEYHWLREQRLTFIQQSLRHTDSGSFDVMRAKDAQGNERDYYFNVTQIYSKTLRKSVRNP